MKLNLIIFIKQMILFYNIKLII